MPAIYSRCATRSGVAFNPQLDKVGRSWTQTNTMLAVFYPIQACLEMTLRDSPLVKLLLVELRNCTKTQQLLRLMKANDLLRDLRSVFLNVAIWSRRHLSLPA